MPTSEVQVGLAKVFGLGSAAITVLTGAATLTLSRAGFSDEFELIEDPDQEGNCETLVAYNQNQTLDLTIVPNGATRAAAIVSLQNCLPSPITKVVTASFDASHLNGNFNYVGGWNVEVTRTGLAIVTMKIKAWIPNRASLTAGVIVG